MLRFQLILLSVSLSLEEEGVCSWDFYLRNWLAAAPDLITALLQFRKLHLLANNPEERGSVAGSSSDPEEPVQSGVESTAAPAERMINHRYQPLPFAIAGHNHPFLRSPLLLTSLERTPSVCREAMPVHVHVRCLHNA